MFPHAIDDNDIGAMLLTQPHVRDRRTDADRRRSVDEVTVTALREKDVDDAAVAERDRALQHRGRLLQERRHVEVVVAVVEVVGFGEGIGDRTVIKTAT